MKPSTYWILLVAQILIPTTGAYSEEALRTTIEVDSNVYSKEEFKKVTPHVKDKLPPLESITSSETRDRIFSQVSNLGSYLEGMGEMDKDVLLIRAKGLSITKLTQKYPSIPKKILASLKVAVREKRK